MATKAAPRSRGTRRLTVIAQDPSIKRHGKIVTARIAVPYENLREGPWGHRVQVVDYDASLDRFRVPDSIDQKVEDPYEGKDAGRLIGDPEFHAWNSYAIVMAT